jgi:F-type H+-transporting ATPase subunit gamma
LNSNLFRYLETAIFVKEQKKVHFITIGTKAHKFIKESGWGDIICSYNELNSNNFITVADSLVERIINTPVRYSSVSLLGSERRSFFSQRPRKVTLVPLAFDQPKLTPHEQVTKDSMVTVPSQSHEEEIIWEQRNEEILEVLSVGYLRCSIIDMLFQSLLSEYAARFLAMDNSTTNAEKYLDRLTLQYNKARQAAITKEVSELSAGCLGQ